MAIATINPTTGVTERTFEAYTEAEVDRRLDDARTAFESYRHTTYEERGRWLYGAADLLDGEGPDLARIMTTEMGKTFAAARAEVAKCAVGLRWFADNAERLLADDVIESPASDSRAIYRPLGAVLAVMPWNFPMWQVMRFAAPALMVGDVALLKHAGNVPQTALAIEDVFRRAGLPQGVFQTLLVGSDRVAGIIADDRIDAVTLTGSEGAGRSVAEAAGRALKKTVLELGGSDPFVVLSSADLSRAVEVGVQARVQNNGQSCIAAKRFIVHEDVYDDFEQAFVAGMAKLVVGDPMDPATEVGPLATAQAVADVASQVDDARSKGAAVLCGGEVPGGAGFFYPPTVLAGIAPGMRVASEEVFAPVAMLHRAADAADALRIANDSAFGLGASVWTEDAAEQQRFAEELQVGMVFCNAMVVSSPSLPFGGVKHSGYGRELGSPGIHEFCVIKTVYRN